MIESIHAMVAELSNLTSYKLGSSSNYLFYEVNSNERRANQRAKLKWLFFVYSLSFQQLIADFCFDQASLMVLLNMVLVECCNVISQLERLLIKCQVVCALGTPSTSISHRYGTSRPLPSGLAPALPSGLAPLLHTQVQTHSIMKSD